MNDAYGEFRNLVNKEDIMLCPDPLLIGEMKNLAYKWVSRGFKRVFDAQSEYPSDDVCDAVAGATFQAMKSEVVKQLPRSVLTSFPQQHFRR